MSQRPHQIVVPPLHLVARSRCVSLVDVLLEFFPRDHCSPWEHIRGGWVACDHDTGIRQPVAAGGDYFNRLDPDKQARRLVAQLERLGHVVTLQKAAA